MALDISKKTLWLVVILSLISCAKLATPSSTSSPAGANQLVKLSAAPAYKAPLEPPQLGSKPSCSTEYTQQVFASANINKPLHLTCSLVFPPAASLQRPLLLHGTAASGVSINCRGGHIAHSNTRYLDTIEVSAIEVNKSWSVPEHIRIANCAIDGSIRVMGMGRNGEAEPVRASSISDGHTARAQTNAPQWVTLSNLIINAKGRVPVYFAPGVRNSSLTNSHITGVLDSVAVYLDAESAYNRIRNNFIQPQSSKRELIAIDGSAHNHIAHNVLVATHGGVFAYRNCGEGGTVRHQSPVYNYIENNVFWAVSSFSLAKPKPMVWLGSRNGKRNYCHADAGYNFGSSIDNADGARNNVVQFNNVINASGSKTMLSQDGSNLLYQNGFKQAGANKPEAYWHKLTP